MTYHFILINFAIIHIERTVFFREWRPTAYSMSEHTEDDDRRVRLAIEIFCYRERKYVGTHLAAMGGAVAIVFTGGIGENSPDVRARICAGVQWIRLRVSGNKIAFSGCVCWSYVDIVTSASHTTAGVLSLLPCQRNQLVISRSIGCDAKFLHWDAGDNMRKEVYHKEIVNAVPNTKACSG
jgi:hypothetical protein